MKWPHGQHWLLPSARVGCVACAPSPAGAARAARRGSPSLSSPRRHTTGCPGAARAARRWRVHEGGGQPQFELRIGTGTSSLYLTGL